MNLELHIKNLVVTGPANVDSAAVRETIERELASLLEGTPDARLRRVETGKIASSTELLHDRPAEDATALGRQIAAAIHQCITR